MHSRTGDDFTAPIVVIGAGQAGAQAVTVLRQEGYGGEVILFGDEPHLPYQRPPLSKQYLAGELAGDRLALRARQFYRDKGITLRIGETITAVDCAAHAVIDSNGRSTRYGALLLATGARPRRLNIPGAGLAGIHYLRNVDDADAIRGDMRPGRKLMIIGGGYIGLEVASVAATAGLDVTVVEVEERILQRVTTPTMSAFYAQLHRDHGVRILTGTIVERFGGDGRVTHACSGEQRFEVDLVLIGIGVVPNVELAADAGIDCDNGIVVDAYARTSQPRIFAAGDCTNHPNPLLDRRLRLESVPNAMDQAKVAAANLAGGDRIYATVPWFWSDQYGLKLQMAGFSSDADTQILRGDPAAQQFTMLYLRDGRLVGVDAVNSPRDFMAGKLFHGRRLETTRLADPTVELKSALLDRDEHA
jgi:3-phenylpropionate/trans-cinnamate dioxygenase ferredoxin reductase component